MRLHGGRPDGPTAPRRARPAVDPRPRPSTIPASSTTRAASASSPRRARAGRRADRVVPLALEALAALTHRGAIAADARTGDGAGIALPATRRLRRGPGRATPASRRRPGAPRGRRRLPAGRCGRQATRRAGSSARRWPPRASPRSAGGACPVDPSVLGPEAAASAPEIRQVLVARPAGMGPARFERALLVARRAAEAAAAAAAGLEAFHVASLSTRTLVYKGLFVGGGAGPLLPAISGRPACASPMPSSTSATRRTRIRRGPSPSRSGWSPTTGRSTPARQPRGDARAGGPPRRRPAGPSPRRARRRRAAAPRPGRLRLHVARRGPRAPARRRLADRRRGDGPRARGAGAARRARARPGRLAGGGGGADRAVGRPGGARLLGRTAGRLRARPQRPAAGGVRGSSRRPRRLRLGGGHAPGLAGRDRPPRAARARRAAPGRHRGGPDPGGRGRQAGGDRGGSRGDGAARLEATTAELPKRRRGRPVRRGPGRRWRTSHARRLAAATPERRNAASSSSGSTPSSSG